MGSLYPALIINWLTSPGGTRHRITKFIPEDAIMETLLLNSTTPETRFEIGVITGEKQFIEDAINQIKREPNLLNKVCIASMLARSRLMQKGYWQ
ncbi:cell division inhibition protein DicB [Escherichia marmotae]|uniref:cell division inhibition protein DicB n=1 Tax=Escherichia marmotae TaxID=1499973 RepID=UPI002ACA7595|nr:cell division inhibition protein DicB [Escherichia marmotae]MDZ5519117.1 cell division inhibition protein DicB [Escherichia marmotae]